MIYSGCAADNGSGSYVAGDAALRRDNGAIADFAVTHHSNLPGENDFVADIGRAGEAYLCGQQRVFSDVRAVADLHQVVNFRAATYARFADAGAVNAGIGLDLYVVLYYDRLWLRNLVPLPAIVFRKAEAIASTTTPFCRRTLCPIRQPSRTMEWAWAKKLSPILASR